MKNFFQKHLVLFLIVIIGAVAIIDLILFLPKYFYPATLGLCYGEGIKPEDFNKHCCPGLKETPAGAVTYGIDYSKKTFRPEPGLDLVAAPLADVCINCGDGKCKQKLENAQNCPADCCVSNVQQIAGKYNCCANLTKIKNLFFDKSTKKCVNVYGDANLEEGNFLCSHCGNKECEEPENECNCPQDCR